GIFETDEDKNELREKIKDRKIKLIFMRNHGFVAMGETAEEAWLLTYYTVLACETQVKTMVGGMDNVIIPSEKSVQQAYEVAQRGANNHDNKEWKQYRYGEFEWEAWMRELDARGYVTGHVYQAPH
uniref:Class II aldolase/adducin N-terminal domain-containing protein n=1 Tax=Acrobeloides nanus TaxID=290746 RepID=A0A914CV25_9BILA